MKCERTRSLDGSERALCRLLRTFRDLWSMQKLVLEGQKKCNVLPSLGIMLFLKSRKPSLNSSSLDFVSLEFPFDFLTKGPSVSTYLKSIISTLRPISSLAHDRVPFNQEH